jgi:hypothetical protein
VASGFHLAQLNIARLIAPLDAPELADFVAWLEPINALADTTPGFVWRLQTEDGDATSVRAFDDDTIIVNLSVWESVHALHAFVYRSEHNAVFARRKEWFERIEQPYLVCWWIPAGEIPTVADAVVRLEKLRSEGPTPEAFTLRSPFGVPHTV